MERTDRRASVDQEGVAQVGAGEVSNTGVGGYSPTACAAPS